MYQTTPEEQTFLQSYNIAQYERPSLAADIALFALSRNDADIKNIGIEGIQILLIKRANYPYKDKWALPGGFCIPSETIQETARRELTEETGVDNTYLQFFRTYSEQDRDPRGWIISNTFLSMVDKNTCHLRADTDAWDAAWFTIQNYHTIECMTSPTTKEITHIFQLYNPESKEVLNTSYIEEIEAIQPIGNCFKYHPVDLRSDLAFDHGRIIGEAIAHIRNTVKHDLRMLFYFFPEMFTIGELKAAYEVILDTPDVANFRRMINGYVTETDMIIKNKGYRPAKLYIRNANAFF